MTPLHALPLLLDPARLLAQRGLRADDWQRRLLAASDRQVLMNCSRQSGKSTTVATLALHRALFRPGSLVLLLSPSLRQSGELFRKVLDLFGSLDQTRRPPVRSQTRLELLNGSRIIGLPGREETIRGFSGVALLVIDEAARVPDDLYRSVRPMLAASQGRLICLSTPFGRRGFFFEEWHDPAAPWLRVRVPWDECPRIRPEFIEEERRALGEAWVRQEYGCSFEALTGLVYPDFEIQTVCEPWPESVGRPVGGIDFGFRNPFAALWGVLDRDDVLWLGHERYLRETPIFEHARALPRNVIWYADPAGRTETEELRRAGVKVYPGTNDIQAGIAAVTARLRTGRLRVHRAGCPNLLHEARLYRYPETRAGQGASEVPIDDFNHALAALRYLISKLDAGFMARFRKTPGSPGGVPEGEPTQTSAGPTSARPRVRLDQDDHWTPLRS